MKTDLEPWKSNLEPWKTIKTNLNHWKPIKTEMEPWKTNLEPSKLTWSCRGWLWGVQVVTGDSQEEVIIFRDKQTDMHHNIYITAGCEGPNSKNYWSWRSTRKKRRCSQIGGRPLKAKLGTINKYLEILARTASQGWEGMQPMLMIFLFHIKKIVWQFQMRILFNIVTNPS